VRRPQGEGARAQRARAAARGGGQGRRRQQQRLSASTGCDGERPCAVRREGRAACVPRRPRAEALDQHATGRAARPTRRGTEGGAREQGAKREQWSSEGPSVVCRVADVSPCCSLLCPCPRPPASPPLFPVALPPSPLELRQQPTRRGKGTHTLWAQLHRTDTVSGKQPKATHEHIVSHRQHSSGCCINKPFK